jgi:O-antigen/teichoic acid export membrane protein|tara:strand:- start:43 stop:372 length:330 start_codon:yes stop_codon:yes gene_type:complete
MLIGAIIGLIVGIIKNNPAVWLGVGAALGLLLGLGLKGTHKTKRNEIEIKSEKLMWIGFFLIVPIMFFGDFLKGSFWFDVFGILALIGSAVVIINFINLMKERRKSDNS